MIIYAGVRPYGKVHGAGDTYVVTRFAHLQLFPLFPQQSHLVVGERGAVAIDLQWRSVLAGYARVWGSVAMLPITAIALVFIEGVEDDVSALAALVALVVLVALMAAAWLWLGRLSLDELGHRVVYARRCGAPVDPALLPDGAELARRIREVVVERAPALRSADYRSAPDPETGWRAVATDPSVTDRAYLEDALVLTRLAAAATSGPARAALLADHARIWETLREAAPDLLVRARAYRPRLWRRLVAPVLVAASIGLVGLATAAVVEARIDHHNGRLAEVLRPGPPPVESDHGYHPGLGEQVTNDTRLPRDRMVFVLRRPGASAALRWYTAEVRDAPPGGDVRVRLRASGDEVVVPRASVRLIDR